MKFAVAVLLGVLTVSQVNAQSFISPQEHELTELDAASEAKLYTEMQYLITHGEKISQEIFGHLYDANYKYLDYNNVKEQAKFLK